MIEDKDSLILERSTAHRLLIDENSLLKEEIDAKVTELGRTEKALDEQLGDIKVYKEKLRSQHEELLGRLRLAEEALKEVAAYGSSLTKLVVLVYSKSIEAFEHQDSSKSVGITKEFETLLKELERNFQPIQEKRSKKPKRIIGSLEEVKNSYKFINDRIKAEKWIALFDAFCKEGGSPNREKLSFRSSSFRSPSLVPVSATSNITQADTIESLTCALSPEGNELLNNLSKIIKDTAKSQIKSQEDLDKLFSHNLMKCLDKAKDYIDKHSQTADTVSKYRINRQSSLAGLQLEHVNLTQAAADDEITDLESQIYDAMMSNAALKDQLVSDQHALQRHHANIKVLTDENTSMQTQLDDLDHSVREAVRMLEAENEQYDKLLLELNQKKYKLRSIESEHSTVKNQIYEINPKIKHISKMIKESKSSLSSPLVIMPVKSEAKDQNDLAPQSNILAVELTTAASPIKRGTSHEFASPFTPLKDLVSTKTLNQQVSISSLPNDDPLKQQLAKLQLQVKDQQRLDDQDIAYTKLVDEFKSLCMQVAKHEAIDLRSKLFADALNNIIANMSSLKDSCTQMEVGARQAEESLNKKRSELSQIVAEESKSREAYIKSELKLELHHQKILTLQDSIDKYRTMMADAQKQASYKRRDELRLNEKLDRAKEQMVELQPVYRVKDEENGIREALIPKDDVTMPPVVSIDGISYLRVCIACAIPVMIAYLLQVYR